MNAPKVRNQQSRCLFRWWEKKGANSRHEVMIGDREAPRDKKMIGNEIHRNSEYMFIHNQYYKLV